MARVEKSLEINVPVRTAYNQWTQFETFPSFMSNIREVQQIDDSHLHWRAVIGGISEEWDAVITEQIPDQRITWRSTSGAENIGSVSFNSLGPDRTLVTLTLEYNPEGLLENIGTVLGVLSSNVIDDLWRFKGFIEERQQATGAWRGEIHNPEPGQAREVARDTLIDPGSSSDFGANLIPGYEKDQIPDQFPVRDRGDPRDIGLEDDSERQT